MMKNQFLTMFARLSVLGLVVPAQASILGAAGSFAVLGGSAVTNTGASVLRGHLGVSPGSAISGFSAVDSGPGTVHGAIHAGDAMALLAEADLTTAYNSVSGEAATEDLTGQDLGGLTLTPRGVSLCQFGGSNGGIDFGRPGGPERPL